MLENTPGRCVELKASSARSRIVSLPGHGGANFGRRIHGNQGLSAFGLDALFDRRFAYQRAYAATNLRAIVALAHQHDVPLASHDDTAGENVTDAVRDRVSVAKFPTTMEAARGLHEAGIGILMGAPNVVRGGSHSGNIAAVDLARERLLDILSSDYIPSSLLMAAQRNAAIATSSFATVIPLRRHGTY